MSTIKETTTITDMYNLKNDLCEKLSLTPAQAEKVVQYLSLTDDRSKAWGDASSYFSNGIRLPCNEKDAREYGGRVFPPLFGNVASQDTQKKMSEVVSEQMQLTAKLCAELVKVRARIKALEDKKSFFEKLQQRVSLLVAAFKARWQTARDWVADWRKPKISTQARLEKELSEMSEEEKKLLVAQLKPYWDEKTAKKIAEEAAKQKKQSAKSDNSQTYEPLGDIYNHQKLGSFEAEKLHNLDKKLLDDLKKYADDDDKKLIDKLKASDDDQDQSNIAPV